jgi:hypothetical protein
MENSLDSQKIDASLGYRVGERACPVSGLIPTAQIASNDA